MKSLRAMESGGGERVLYEQYNIYQVHKEIHLYIHICLNLHFNGVCASVYTGHVQKTFAWLYHEGSLQEMTKMKKMKHIWIDLTDNTEGKRVSTNNVINSLLIGFFGLDLRPLNINLLW